MSQKFDDSNTSLLDMVAIRDEHNRFSSQEDKQGCHHDNAVPTSSVPVYKLEGGVALMDLPYDVWIICAGCYNRNLHQRATFQCNPVNYAFRLDKYLKHKKQDQSGNCACENEAYADPESESYKYVTKVVNEKKAEEMVVPPAVAPPRDALELFGDTDDDFAVEEDFITKPVKSTEEEKGEKRPHLTDMDTDDDDSTDNVPKRKVGKKGKRVKSADTKKKANSEEPAWEDNAIVSAKSSESKSSDSETLGPEPSKRWTTMWEMVLR